MRKKRGCYWEAIDHMVSRPLTGITADDVITLITTKTETFQLILSDILLYFPNKIVKSVILFADLFIFNMFYFVSMYQA